MEKKFTLQNLNGLIEETRRFLLFPEKSEFKETLKKIDSFHFKMNERFNGIVREFFSSTDPIRLKELNSELKEILLIFDECESISDENTINPDYTYKVCCSELDSILSQYENGSINYKKVAKFLDENKISNLLKVLTYNSYFSKKSRSKLQKIVKKLHTLRTNLLYEYRYNESVKEDVNSLLLKIYAIEI
jgi:DNA-binding ferritin-like protein (Dps family)